MTLLTALLETEEHFPIIAPPWVFAGIAAAIFITLGFVTWSFRDVSNRHSDKVHATEPHDDDQRLH